MKNKNFVLKKVGTQENIADILTKHVPGENIKKHMNSTNQGFEEGRRDIMRQVEKIRFGDNEAALGKWEETEGGMRMR